MQYVRSRDRILNQGWPTQVGLWAAFEKISKNIDFLGQFLTKADEITLKISKNHPISIQNWAGEFF
jgi:hypothetical protein